MIEDKPALRWNILPDQEVSSSKADTFGVHTAFAKLLQRIASSCPTPFTIGLYSTWGSGKTSIVRLLQETVAKEQRRALSVVYLDVWKYSADPLKRWILLETERQLTEQHLLNDYRFQGRSMRSHLEFEESLEDNDRIEIDFKNFGRLIGALLVLIILCGLIWLYVPAEGLIREVIKWIAAFSAGGGALALILTTAFRKIGESLSGIIFRRSIKHVTAKPAFSSEKFSEIFRDMVATATTAGKSGRLLFVFDNLDRCPADIAVDLIGVIKTFLDEPKCVYLVPCDEQAILTHIKATFQKVSDLEASDFHANQFLTKFFQMTLRLPPAADFAVEDYLEREIKEAGLGDLTTDARDVLVLGYRGETPRQVKRVLNDLIAYRGIAEQIEAEGLVEKGALTSDLGHLTKMAVLSAKWPSFMRRLADDPVLWTEVMQRVRLQANLEMEGIETDLQQFLWNTRLVSPDVDIRPWLYLRRGALEKDAALNRRIEGMLQDGAWSSFLALLNEEATKDKKREILQIVSSTVRRWQNSNRRLLVRNGGPVLLKAALATPEDAELRKDALDALDYLASNASAEEMEQVFDVKDVIAIASSMASWQKEKLLTKYAELFSPRFPATETRTEIWKQLLQHGDLLTDRERESISRELTSRYTVQNGESDALAITQFVAQDAKSRNWCISGALMERISASVTFDNSDIDNKRLDAIVAFQDTAGMAARALVSNKISQSIDAARTSQPDAQATRALGLLSQIKADWFEPHQQIIDNLLTQARRPPTGEKGPWVNGLIQMFPLHDEPARSEIEKLLTACFLGDPNEALKLVKSLPPDSRAKLLEITTFRSDLRSQPSNYVARYGTSARSYREQIVAAFEASSILAHPEIFDDKLSWDLAVYIQTAARTLGEKALTPEAVATHVESFCRAQLPASLGTQNDLYDELLKFVDGQPEISSAGIGDIIAACELSKVLAGAIASYQRFALFKGRLPAARRLELTRNVLTPLSERANSWVHLLSLIIDDVTADSELGQNLAIVSDLADYAFTSAREKWTEVGNTLTKAVALLDGKGRQEYTDRSLDVLLSLEAEGEDLPKMEPFLALVLSNVQVASGTIASKCTKFVQRMLGASRSDPAKIQILRFASCLNSDILTSLRQSIEPLTESTNIEVSAEAKTAIAKLAAESHPANTVNL